MLEVELFGIRAVNPKQVQAAPLFFVNEGAWRCISQLESIHHHPLFPKKWMEVAFFFRNLLSDLFGFVSKYIDLKN